MLVFAKLEGRLDIQFEEISSENDELQSSLP
jgi:hypothetical protein